MIARTLGGDGAFGEVSTIGLASMHTTIVFRFGQGHDYLLAVVWRNLRVLSLRRGIFDASQAAFRFNSSNDSNNFR